MRFRMRSDAGQLAQMPMSVFFNNHLLKTITITGTDGEWLERDVELNVNVSLEMYVKLYFGESGIEMDEIRVCKI